MRPLIDFLRLDDLPWQERLLPGSRQPVRARLLSEDPEQGEQTLVVELPPGWALSEEGYLDADTELFVLAGELELNGQRLTRYGYQLLPAGQLRRSERSERGARLLLFQAAARFLPAHDHGPMFRPERAVGPVHLRQVAYEQPRTPGFPAGAGRKTLRLDAATGEGFWVIGMLPFWISPFLETHTFSEENYVLEGEIETGIGLMTADSYLHHPPGVLHGPMRSRRGCLVITRAVGPFQTEFHRVPGDYTFPEEW
jgi:hypothetical protein